MYKHITTLIISIVHCFSLSCALGSSLSEPSVIPVAIIGSGVAGLGAAATSAKRGYKTVVFQGPIPRGGLNYDSQLKDWLGATGVSGKEVMATVESQALQQGAELVPTTITHVDFSTWPFSLTTAEGTTLHAYSVVIATGTSAKKLTVPGAETYLWRGVYMDISKKDTHFAQKKTVVVGSGHDAVKKALKLASMGAHSVTILVRGSSMKVDKDDMQELSQEPSIRIQYHSEITSVYGNESSLEGAIVAVNGSEENLECEAIVVAIGTFPTTDLFLSQLDLGPSGEILVKPMSQITSVPGVTAAGTCVDPRYRKGFISASDGMKAGYDATDFLREKGIPATH